MSAKPLSYGLNFSKIPKKPSGPPKPKASLSKAFTNDSESDDNADNGVFSKGNAKSKTKEDPSRSASSKSKDRKTMNATLATYNALSAQSAATAESAEADASIYDYDGVWEDMKSVTRAKKAAEEEDAVSRKPKYMANLISAAEVRKRDLLRAKEKALQKEREAEGDEFNDKEAFVTDAYRAQQEELVRMEEEERRKEEALKKKSQGMASFHRNMLEKTESAHEMLVKAAEVPTAKKGEEVEVEKEETAEEVARRLKEKGAAVEINEEGQIVDKTQLLSGGLNLGKPKHKAGDKGGERRPAVDPRKQTPAWKRQQQQDSIARQSKMLEDQLVQAQKREAEEDAAAQEDLVKRAKSKKSETDVKSAKERYLARKAAAAKEKK